MKNLTIPSPFKYIKRFFVRFHTTIFILLILGLLVTAVLFITNILNDASIGADYQSPISAGSIDQATLDRINALHSSSDPVPPALPQGVRVSPFSE